jgi:PmbA protein
MSTRKFDPFFYSPQQLRDMSHRLVDMALSIGATGAAAEVSEQSGLSVTVRMGQLETIERTRDKSAGITVYQGQRRGHATTSDLSEGALKDTVRRAFEIARHTAEDAFSGLPEEAEIARLHRDLALFYPWNIDAQGATSLALKAESAARGVSPAIRNSEGASVSASHGQFHASNSRGFSGGYPYSRHWVSVAPIAQQGDQMQRDDWYTTSRDPALLADPAQVGLYAARRALSRLGARQIPTGEHPVVFEAPLAVSLIGSLVNALSGSALYRKASFLVDSMGTSLFPDHIEVTEDPFVMGGDGSTPFDDEGVEVRPRTVIDQGRVAGYFLSTYSARKLGMKTTGNAGGAHNLVLRSSKTQPQHDLPKMIKEMGRGLLVTEVMGQGVNVLTGDYSRGAFGYWVEGGEIQFPVEEVTIAGNLKTMYRGIQSIGADTMTRGTRTTGSILIDRMMVAGT